MGIKQYSRRNIYGLNSILDAKIGKEAIRKTLDDVLNATSPDAVVGTGAIADLKSNLEDKINKALQTAQAIIDDTATSGNKTTWSVDKIKEFVTSIENIVVKDIDERNKAKAFNGLIAYVIDTSKDMNLGPDFKGKPFAYIYTNGAWHPITPLSKEIDSTVFIKYSDIINNLTDGGKNKPLSAEMGKKINNEVIPKAVMSMKQEFVVDEVTIKDNKIETSKTINGTIVFNCVEIETDKGVVIVDANVTGPKEVTIYPSGNDSYENQKAKVTYMAFTYDDANNIKCGESDDGEADGVVVTSGSGSASGSSNSSSAAKA